MAGLCEGGNEPSGSLKAISRSELERWVNSDKGILTKELYFPTVYDRNKYKPFEGPRPTSRLLASRPHVEAEVDDHPTRMKVSCG
ncbi:hypothetical protein ANN_17950 [Periplaneta americana]|uniref:Uncharacterized protein n=1 Tax=Periplaneta americana TaxID=6978 RepID=A0ABQ8SME5_PERAM|nr:hypothetical protein ANN_17950 [Periplaneta americana]